MRLREPHCVEPAHVGFFSSAEHGNINMSRTVDTLMDNDHVRDELLDLELFEHIHRKESPNFPVSSQRQASKSVHKTWASSRAQRKCPRRLTGIQRRRRRQHSTGKYRPLNE